MIQYLSDVKISVMGLSPVIFQLAAELKQDLKTHCIYWCGFQVVELICVNLESVLLCGLFIGLGAEPAR